ncbi:hypothetical protein L195_g063128, partial [Trifolium pratense]
GYYAARDSHHATRNRSRGNSSSGSGYYAARETATPPA